MYKHRSKVSSASPHLKHNDVVITCRLWVDLHVYTHAGNKRWHIDKWYLSTICQLQVCISQHSHLTSFHRILKLNFPSLRHHSFSYNRFEITIWTIPPFCQNLASPRAANRFVFLYCTRVPSHGRAAITLFYLLHVLGDKTIIILIRRSWKKKFAQYTYLVTSYHPEEVHLDTEKI